MMIVLISWNKILNYIIIYTMMRDKEGKKDKVVGNWCK